MARRLIVDGFAQNQKMTPLRRKFLKIHDDMCGIYDIEIEVKQGQETDLDLEPEWARTMVARTHKSVDLIEELGDKLIDLGPDFGREYPALSYVAQAIKVFFARSDLLDPEHEYDLDCTDIHEILTEEVMKGALLGTRQLVEALKKQRHLCLKCRKQVEELPVLREEPEEQ
ncbi:hypothetical protein KEM54_005139 [Ascosphaera aggregata]|nr:hypothetical protein KEM54_005139 [Ascosphaera aggregata]